MSLVSTTTVSSVAEHDLAVAWCSDLFGREPDRRPMEPSAERQRTDISSVMVDADPGDPAGNAVVFAQDAQ